MTNTLHLPSNFDTIFKDLAKFSVGFEPTARILDQVRNIPNPNYPPYNLEQITDSTLRLSLALAGFRSEELDISVQEKTLTISGNQKTDSTRNFLFKGIAERNFTRTFYLDPTIHITGADFQDGILTIDFEQIIPESQKPKKIEIKSKVTKIDSEAEEPATKSKTTKITNL